MAFVHLSGPFKSLGNFTRENRQKDITTIFILKQGLAAHTRTAYPTKVGHDVSNGPLYIFTIPCKLNTFTQHDPEP